MSACTNCCPLPLGLADCFARLGDDLPPRLPALFWLDRFMFLAFFGNSVALHEDTSIYISCAIMLLSCIFSTSFVAPVLSDLIAMSCLSVLQWYSEPCMVCSLGTLAFVPVPNIWENRN